MPVSMYMMMCLHDPEAGYYATRPGLGRDFTTAPEISQIFGEMIGLWCVSEWRAMGRPAPFHLTELGPGRGVMMADCLRAAGKADPDFASAARPALVEASPALRAEQASRLAGYAPVFCNSLAEAPGGPGLVLANEFLDCMPVRQFVRDGERFRERLVGTDGTDLVFGLGEAVILSAADTQNAGEALEIAFSLEAFLQELAGRILRDDVRALLIDYGPSLERPGDTLRAFRGGEQVHPLENPGSCDLTADVDFGRLRRLAEAAGLACQGPVGQGLFLASLGAELRAARLAGANPLRSADIHAGVQTLLDPDGMGARFKAIRLSGPEAAPSPGFDGSHP